VEERLVAVLRPQESLLLLDNFEHVASAAPVVADLLAVCPRLKVCVTSRSPLHLRSEHRYTVAPLTLPSHETSRYTIEALTAVPAVTLLVERACAARADFVLTPKNAAAVSDICRRLDGLPLALELAAARLALFSPHELLARLDHAMDLLADGPQDLPIRQRALRGALAWSYELLTPPERAVFRWLAVCAGGCTLEDAEGLCAAIAMQTTAMQTTQTEVGADLQHAPPMHAPLALVARLIDHSLLQRWETAAGAAGPAVRLGMLEVVRDFATECLRTSGEEEAARRSHASYFAAFAETAAPLLAGPEQARWLERLDREAANLRAALAWSLAHPMRLEALAGSEPAYGAAQDMGAREIALRLVGALWRYWYQHGALAEGDQWLERVLARWDSSCVVADAAAAAPLTAPSAAEALGSSESPRLHPDAQLADALYGAGVLAFTRSDFGRAQARYEACLAQRHRLGDARGVAQTLNGLGGVARERGQLDEALTLYEASLTALAEGPEQAGSVLARANARNNIGITRASRGEFASALAAYEEALAAYRRLENRYMIGRCLASMGYCLCELGEYVRARALLAESLALHRAAGDEHGVALTLATLGMVAARQGDHVTAERRWVQAATRYLHVGNVLSVAQCLEELAILRASTGDTSHGVNESQAAVDGEHGVGEALIILGALEAVRSQLGAPLEPIRASLQERVCFTARRTLGGYAYDEAWEAGRALARDRGADETLAMCLARLRRAL
jgi:predicted ATPase